MQSRFPFPLFVLQSSHYLTMYSR